MSTPLGNVKGVGVSTVEDLEAKGIKSAEDLAAASVEQIVAVPGFGETRARRIKQAAADTIAALPKKQEHEVVDRESVEPDEPAKKKGKKEGKSKKKKKSKKKEKNKDKKKKQGKQKK